MAKKSPKDFKILIVCSRPDDISIYERTLQAIGFSQTINAHSGETALSIIENEDIDLVMIDNDLHPDGGLKHMIIIKRSYPLLPCVLIVRQDEVQTAVQALGMGGDDYLLRDEMFTIGAAYILRELLLGERMERADDLREPHSVFGLLRRVLLLARRIGIHFSFQPGWEGISNDMFSIFDCDLWGYMLFRDTGYELQMFESAPMDEEAEEKILQRINEVYYFHSSDTIDTKHLNLRRFQLFRTEEDLTWPMKDVILPLISEGRTIGVVFMFYKQPRKLTIERVELFEFVASLMSYSLDMGEIFNRLTQLAMYDETTECYNRDHFLKQLEIETIRVERYNGLFSLVLIDLDGFKNINLSHGYEAGNLVLSQVAALLREQIRTIDILARIGGEEFAIILPSTDIEGARLFGERIRKVIAEQEFEVGELRTASLTATIAVGEYIPRIHHSGEGLLARLERMLAMDKSVKNQVLVES